MGKHDTPGVIAPPPLIYLAALIIGVILHYLAPTPFMPRGFAYGLGAILILIGVWIVISGRQAMLKAGTAISPTVPTTALVIVGPFRFTRNPLYAGVTLCYVGIALAFQSLWALALLVVVLTVMQRGVIEREERYLERKFGTDYLRYKERVRRWI
jgi:protein-S-isoprenylcysteine O-methyltransferase Ste14